MRLDNTSMSRETPANGDNNILHEPDLHVVKPHSLPTLKEEAKTSNGNHKTDSAKEEVNGKIREPSISIPSQPALPPVPSAFEGVLPMSSIMSPRVPTPFVYRSPMQLPYRPAPLYASTVPHVSSYPLSLVPNAAFFPSPGPGYVQLPFAGQYPRPQIPAFLAAPGIRPLVPMPSTPEVLRQENPPRPPPGEASLGSLDDPPKQKNLLSGKAYKSRNVYKSIVRHLFSYIRKNREDIIRILKDAGFSMTEIEHSFFKINYYNDLEREQSNKKNSQATIKKMVSKRTIYTYILRETLNTMMHNWEQGKLGKVSESNSEVYKDVCKYFYDEAVKMTGQPAQGRTFYL